MEAAGSAWGMSNYYLRHLLEDVIETATCFANESKHPEGTKHPPIFFMLFSSFVSCVNLVYFFLSSQHVKGKSWGIPLHSYFPQRIPSVCSQK